MFGQPSRGLTIRRRVSPKLPIARAAMPMFSPSCGSTRITIGPSRSMPDLVLSVPEPDISLHFLIQGLKILNQAPNNLIQRLSGGRYSIACPAAFLKQYNRVRDAFRVSAKTSNAPLRSGGLHAFWFRIRYQSQPKRTCKTNPRAGQRLGIREAS